MRLAILCIMLLIVVHADYRFSCTVNITGVRSVDVTILSLQASVAFIVTGGWVFLVFQSFVIIEATVIIGALVTLVVVAVVELTLAVLGLF
jgi:hypothetical protein